MPNEVRRQGDLAPGIESIEEEVEASVTISEGNTSGTINASLSGAYDSAPELVGVSFRLANASGASAASYIDGHNVTARGTGQIDIEVHLDAAPGTGESVDVVAQGWVSGDVSR